jgi:hypothetical protein
MNDSSIQTSNLITAVLWMAVAALLAAAWIVALVGPWQIAMMLGFSTCATAAAAAVSHIRCYALRIIGLVRAVSGLGAPPAEATDIHLMR